MTTPFRHPATLLDLKGIEDMRNRVQVAKLSFAVTSAQRLAANARVDHQPRPVPIVDCRWNGQQIGHQELNVADAPMAFMCTLQYLLTRDERFAQTAIRIIRAWCNTCTSCVGENRNLEASWSQANMCRSLELLKYTWPGYAATGIEPVYNRWLDTVMLPAINQPINWRIYNGDPAGNWQVAMCEANMQIAVFRNDVPRFDAAVAEYRRILPIIIKPSGLGNEILRDLCHASMSQGSFIHCCEIARNARPSLDLFAERDHLLAKGMEYLAAVCLGERNFPEIAGKTIKLPDVWPQGSWQLGFQAFVVRKRMNMPQTRRLVETRSPVWHWLSWGYGNLMAARV
jgi:hypothetical protein